MPSPCKMEEEKMNEERLHNMEIMMKVSPMDSPKFVRTEASREGLEKALGGKVAEEFKIEFGDSGIVYIAALNQDDPTLVPNRIFRLSGSPEQMVVRGDIVLYGKDEEGNISRLPSLKKGFSTLWIPKEVVETPEGGYTYRDIPVRAFG